MTNKISIVLAILALVLGGIALTKESKPVEPMVGGLTEYQSKLFAAPVTFDQGIVESSVLSTTSPANRTLNVSDLKDTSVILMNPTVGAITVTLPTAANLGSEFLPQIGDSKEVTIVNSTSTAAAVITVAGNTGTSLRKASTSAAVIPGGVGFLKFVRTSATTFAVFLTNGI